MTRRASMRLREVLGEAVGRVGRRGSTSNPSVAELSRRLARLESSLELTRDQLRSVEAVAELRLTRVERRMDHAELAARVHAVSAWVEREQLATSTTVSVVLATRNRCELLARAVESVRSQAYPSWELVAVDDGSSDGTRALLERLASDDGRIVPLFTAHRGSGAARNAGLAAASGDIVCYLDDDNTMAPLWLKAVVWAFSRDPSLEVLYGAQVVDHETQDPLGSRPLPRLRFEPYDRRRLELANYVDLGVIAHRRALPEARFDEALHQVGDWDLFLRLTEHTLPLALPVVASMYHVAAPNRLSNAAPERADLLLPARIRHASRLRTLAYLPRGPGHSATAVVEEMHALGGAGVTLGWCAEEGGSAALGPPARVVGDLEAAVDGFAPDLVLLFDEAFAELRIAQLQSVGVPFALRMQALGDPPAVARVAGHPLCVGVWAHPHDARLVEGAHRLGPLAIDRFAGARGAADRRIVLAASGGLPTRDWPHLVGAFAQLARDGADCRIAVASVPGHEGLPAKLLELVQATGAPIAASVDVPHDRVVQLLDCTAAMVFTVHPSQPLGMPRSIIEAMLAGASVVLPARPEAALVAGRGARTYRRPRDIVRHVTQVLAGGPAVEAERSFNRSFAWNEFADPDLAASFAAQLADAVARWTAG